MAKISLRPALLIVLTINILLIIPPKGYTVEEKFTPVTPQEAVKNMSPGWNLGNTLDAIPTEGSWNNLPVKEYVFDDIKKAGFRTVRIPVTWEPHMGQAPDYKVDPKWFDRVEQVVDWALKRDFYVILDAHNDDRWLAQMAIDAETGKYVNDYENNIGKFDKLWEQIAERFKGKSEKLILEILNEPDPGQWETPLEKPTDPKNPEVKYQLTPKQMTDLNNRILKIIRSSGGYNDKRLVVVAGLANKFVQTLKFFETPDDKYIILTIHYFDPWGFVSNWGITTWGTNKEKEEVNIIFKELYSAYIENGLPIVLGEWGSLKKNDRLSRWYYNDYIAKTAYKYGMACILWDDGVTASDYFDRENRVWKDGTLKDVTVTACKGIPNSFVFPADTYFRINTHPGDLSVKLELNGNQLVNIYNGKNKLVKGINYTFGSKNSAITIKKEYLAKILKTQDLGTVATLRFDFSQGVDIPLNIIQYSLPKFPENEITVDKNELKSWTKQQYMFIPISYNGTKLARISLIDKTNRKPIIRTWMPYIAINDHFDYDDTGIMFKRDLLNKIETDSLITFEFWPEDVKIEMGVLAIPNSLKFTVVDGDI
jgi:endoglucanase